MGLVSGRKRTIGEPDRDNCGQKRSRYNSTSTAEVESCPEELSMKETSHLAICGARQQRQFLEVANSLNISWRRLRKIIKLRLLLKNLKYWWRFLEIMILENGFLSFCLYYSSPPVAAITLLTHQPFIWSTEAPEALGRSGLFLSP